MEAKKSEGIFRLYIDRAFILQGFGTVVTGTVISGSINLGNEVEILPQHKILRVRGLHICGQSVKEASIGQRAALNLLGIEKSEIERGNVLSLPGFYNLTSRIDARLNMVNESGKKLGNNSNVFFHYGTKEVIAKVIMPAKEYMGNGDSGYVQFKFEERVVVDSGDGYIIRSYSPAFTIGGGKIINPNPKRFKKIMINEYIEELKFLEQANIEQRLDYFIKKNGFKALTTEHLSQILHLSVDELSKLLDKLYNDGKINKLEDVGRQLFINSGIYKKLQDLIISILTDFHKKNILPHIASDKLRGMLPKKIDIEVYRNSLKKLCEDKRINITDNKVSLYTYSNKLNSEQEKIKNKIEELFFKEPFLPPSIDNMGSSKEEMDIVRLLIENGTFIKLEEKIVFHKSAINKAQEILKEYFQKNNEITAAAFRDILKSNRKYAVALIEYFDRLGFTKRIGDKHIEAVQSNVKKS